MDVAPVCAVLDSGTGATSRASVRLGGEPVLAREPGRRFSMATASSVSRARASGWPRCTASKNSRSSHRMWSWRSTPSRRASSGSVAAASGSASHRAAKPRSTACSSSNRWRNSVDSVRGRSSRSSSSKCSHISVRQVRTKSSIARRRLSRPWLAASCRLRAWMSPLMCSRDSGWSAACRFNGGVVSGGAAVGSSSVMDNTIARRSSC